MILDDQQRIPRTISGYLDLYTSMGLPTNVDPRTFLFNVSKFNNQLPRNVQKELNTCQMICSIFYLGLSSLW